MPRLTPAQRAEQAEAKIAALDKRVLSLLKQHSLQGVAESLRRISRKAVQDTEGVPYWGFQWKLADTILERMDQSLYAQHCGDLPQPSERTRRR